MANQGLGFHTVLEHHFEPELAQPPPRPVRWRQGHGCGLMFLRLFMLPHTLAGLGFLGTAIASTLLGLGVLLLGAEVQGHILRKTEHHGSKGGTTYQVRYAFRSGDLEYTDQVAIGAGDYAAVQERQPIEVRVLASMPQRGHWPRLPGYSPVWESTKFWIFAGFWNGILSVFLWQAYGRPWFQRRLLRYGQPTIGMVGGVSQWNNRGQRQYRVQYQYRRAPGDEDDGQVYTNWVIVPAKDAEVHVGDRLTVLYNPRRPKWSWPYRLSDYRVVE